MVKMVSARKFSRQPAGSGPAAIRTLDALACGQLGLTWGELLRVASEFLSRDIARLDDMSVKEVLQLTKLLRTHGTVAMEARQRMRGSK